jgi:hypothetical protein
MEMVFRTLEHAGSGPGNGADPGRFDLRGIFAAVHPDGATLDDAVIKLVLGPWTRDMRRALALMGIAVDLSDASLAPILSTESQQIGRLITEFRERDLWVNHQVHDGIAAPPRLHPFARRAIAHRLGRDTGIAGLRWDVAHTLLRDAATDRGDRQAALYHDLALGRVEEVADGLTDLFDPDDLWAWYDVLLRVTSAPLARPVRAADANRHYRELCAGLSPDATVSGELVVALQLHTDPLGDPVHEMCGVVTDELGELSRRAGTGRAFLLAMSHDFERCWAHWHPH